MKIQVPKKMPFQFPSGGEWSCIKTLESLIKSAGYEVGIKGLGQPCIQIYPFIDIQIDTYRNLERSGKSARGVSFRICHAANNHRIVRRGILCDFPSTIYLSQFRAKVEELAELYSKYEEQQRIQNEAENQKWERSGQTRDRCSELGVVSGNGIRVQPGDGYVSIEFQSVSPEMAQKLIKVMREEI